jgi:hypothetical protein
VRHVDTTEPASELTGTGGSVPEAIVTAVAGAALGWFAGAWLDPVLGAVMAVVAGLNGAISGWRRIYPWRLTAGVIGFVLDSTWAIIPTAGGLLAHLGAAIKGDPGYDASLSTRRNRHVYRRGVSLKPGYALTVGNVVGGAGNLDSARRRRLITDHEYVHVWQARWFGPFYLVLYGLWAGLGALAGIVVWFVRGRQQPLGTMVESVAYYLNPFEWWAYSRDNLWPPPGKVADLGYRKAAIRPLAAVRIERRWTPEADPPVPGADGPVAGAAMAADPHAH